MSMYTDAVAITEELKSRANFGARTPELALSNCEDCARGYHLHTLLNMKLDMLIKLLETIKDSMPGPPAGPSIP